MNIDAELDRNMDRDMAIDMNEDTDMDIDIDGHGRKTRTWKRTGRRTQT